MSYVRTAVTRPVVSQLHVLPIVSRGHAHTSRVNIPTFKMYIPTSEAYVPTYRVSHGTSHAMTYGPVAAATCFPDFSLLLKLRDPSLSFVAQTY